MPKNKILHLITGLNPGGAEKVVFDLSRSLKKLGYDIFVIGISDKNYLLNQFLKAKINARTLNITKSVPSFFEGLKKLYLFIKKNHIKVVHAHMHHALMMAILIKFAIPKLKIVFTSHSFNVGSRKRELIIKCSKIFRDIDIIFSRRMWKSIYKKKAVVIPNGIETSIYEMDIPKNKVFTFVCIGRLELVKNHKFLVDVAVELQNDFEFEIHFVGEGYLKDDLVKYTREMNVEKIFKFLGFRTDINTICNQSHVFLLPSLWEGMPISILEAGSSILPIIATPVGSIPELIDQNMGYLSEIKDFKNTMKFVYHNYDEAMRKAILLNKRIKNHYDLGSITQMHIDVYKNLF